MPRSEFHRAPRDPRKIPTSGYHEGGEKEKGKGERGRGEGREERRGVYDTSIAQLKRFKDDAREVAEGFECGILLEGYNDLKEGDILEAYETRQIERTDLDEVAAAPAPAAVAAEADDDADE